MREIQEGVIVGLEGNFARIRVSAHADCDNCSACSIEGMTILALNPIKASIGDPVRFRQPRGGMLSVAFVLFLLPLLFVFAGIYAGVGFSYVTGFHKTISVIFFALAFFAAAVTVIVFYDRRYRVRSVNFPEIVELIIT